MKRSRTHYTYSGRMNTVDYPLRSHWRSSRKAERQTIFMKLVVIKYRNWISICLIVLTADPVLLFGSKELTVTVVTNTSLSMAFVQLVKGKLSLLGSVPYESLQKGCQWRSRWRKGKKNWPNLFASFFASRYKPSQIFAFFLTSASSAIFLLVKWILQNKWVSCPIFEIFIHLKL